MNMSIPKATLLFFAFAFFSAVGRAQSCNESEQNLLEFYSSMIAGDEANANVQSEKMIKE